MSEKPPVLASLEAGDSLLRVVLDRPKGNILDIEMIAAIRAAVASKKQTPRLRSILFEGQGQHFSFGASVEEHKGAVAEMMLGTFHGLFRDLIEGGKVLLAAVRGQCLGGGLELAAFCHRVFAAPGSKLGNPEIKLGVFAPAASVILPMRVGQPRADDLLLTGRTVDAAEALEIGLVDEVAQDPASAAVDWHTRHLLPLSSVALAHAVRAARARFHDALRTTLDALERQYIDELSCTADAREGIAAFLEKRAPAWKHL